MTVTWYGAYGCGYGEAPEVTAPCSRTATVEAGHDRQSAWVVMTGPYT